MTTEQKVDKLITILQEVSDNLSVLSNSITLGTDGFMIASDVEAIKSAIDDGLSSIY